MNFLIDTQCWLWSNSQPERLNRDAQDLIVDRRNRIYFSAASSWEIAIKVALGKLTLPDTPERYVPLRLAEQGIIGLPIQHAHALRVFSLPLYHHDPFDRLLISQAQLESLPIMTADRQLTKYDVKIIWAGV